MQHPHWPCGAQPSFTERTPSRSRSTVSSVSPGSTGTVTGRPSQVNSSVSDISREDTGPSANAANIRARRSRRVGGLLGLLGYEND